MAWGSTVPAHLRPATEGYEKLNAWLGANRKDPGKRRVGTNKVIIRDAAGDIHVILHKTPVVILHPNGDFTLRTGGWNTPTTRRTIAAVTGLPVWSHKNRVHVAGKPLEEGKRIDPLLWAGATAPEPPDWRPNETIPEDYYALQRHGQPVRLASPREHPETNPRVVEDARMYAQRYGVHFRLPPFKATPATVRADQDHGRLAGAAFGTLTHSPDDPEVKKAYDQFKKEILAQYIHVRDRGLRILPWREPGQPYRDSRDMREDVKKDHRLFFFPTDAGFGTESRTDHPLYEDSPVSEADGKPLKYNDLFRAIHDYFGHAQHGHQFGPTGELRAWVEHARLFSPLARKAMTTETHGQNSWVNFGPHEPWKTPAAERPFADQKAGLLPEAAHPKVKLARPDPAMIAAVRDGNGKAYAGKHYVDTATPRFSGGAGNVSAVFADHLQDEGIPGAHIVRAHADRLATGGVERPLFMSGASPLYEASPEPTVPGDPSASTAAMLSQTPKNPLVQAYRVSPKQVGDPRQWWVGVGHSNEGAFREEGVGHLAQAHDWAEFLHLTQDMPQWLRKALAAHARPVLGKSGRLRLARAKLARPTLPTLGWWLDPKGETHEVPNSLTHTQWLERHHDHPLLSYPHDPLDPDRDEQSNALLDHAFAAGWHRMIHSAGRLLVHNPVKNLTQRQTDAVKDHAIIHHIDDVRYEHPFKRRSRLSRATPRRIEGLGASIRSEGSVNHAKRVELAKRVLAEAGLRAAVRAVLTHTGSESRPAVLAAIQHATNPQHALYAAAWLGLMTQQKRLTVFHTGDGPDVLHVIQSPHAADQVSEYLRRAGVDRFSTESDPAGGTRAFVVNPSADMSVLSRGLNASVTTLNGRADRIGQHRGESPDPTGDAADARADYRSTIRSAESAAGF